MKKVKNNLVKILLFLSIGFMIFNFSAATYAKHTQSMSHAQMKATVQALLKTAFHPKNATDMSFLKYISKDYVQYTDGKTINLKAFTKHILFLRKKIKNVNFKFKYMVVEGNKLADIHYVTITLKNGKKFTTQVNAFFVFKNHKIVETNELTHQLVGGESTKNMGSATK